ncbi:MAG: hypothetical protein LBH14_02530 [Desulfobulbaceae bacterium]|jgi:hypothetical protein|nr:hypothetical protein [Desulfobulbaceae bacterium]
MKISGKSGITPWKDVNVAIDGRGIADISVGQIKVKILNNRIGADRQRWPVGDMINDCFSFGNIEWWRQRFHVFMEKEKKAVMDEKASMEKALIAPSYTGNPPKAQPSSALDDTRRPGSQRRDLTAAGLPFSMPGH